MCPTQCMYIFAATVLTGCVPSLCSDSVDWLQKVWDAVFLSLHGDGSNLSLLRIRPHALRAPGQACCLACLGLAAAFLAAAFCCCCSQFCCAVQSYNIGVATHSCRPFVFYGGCGQASQLFENIFDDIRHCDSRLFPNMPCMHF